MMVLRASRKSKSQQRRQQLEELEEGSESTSDTTAKNYVTKITTMPRPRKRRPPPLTHVKRLLTKLASRRLSSQLLLFSILVLTLAMTHNIIVLCKPNNLNHNHIDRNHHHHHPHQQALQLTDKQLLRKAFESGGDSARSSANAATPTSGGAIQSERRVAENSAASSDRGESDRSQASGSGPGGFQCPEQFGYYTDSKDCTKYYVCVFGEVLHESCTGGLRFSRELQTCDWPRNVECPQGSGSNQTTTTTTTTTTTSENSSSSSSTQTSTASTQAPPTTTPTSSSSSTLASSGSSTQASTTPASVTSTSTQSSSSSSQDNRMKGGNQNSLVYADESSDPQQPSFDEAISPVITADGAIHLHDGSGGTFALGPNHNRALVSSSPQSFNGPVEAGSLSGTGNGGAQSNGQDVDVFVMPLTVAQHQQQQRGANNQRARFQQQPAAGNGADQRQAATRMSSDRQQQQQQGRQQPQADGDSARDAGELSDESGDFQLGPGGEQEGGAGGGPNGGEMSADVGAAPPGSDSSLGAQADQEGGPNDGPLDATSGAPLTATESSIAGDQSDQSDPNTSNDYVDDSSGQPPAAGYIPPVPLTGIENRQFSPNPRGQQQQTGGTRQSSALLSINNRQIVDPTRQTFKPIIAPTPPTVSTNSNIQQQQQQRASSQLISSSPRDRQQQQSARNFQQQQQQTTNVNNRQNNQQQLQSLQNSNAQNNRQSRMSAGFSNLNGPGVAPDSSPAPQNPLLFASTPQAQQQQQHQQLQSSFSPATRTFVALPQASADSRQQQLMSSNVNFNDSSKLVRVGPGGLSSQTGGGHNQQLTPTFSRPQQPSARSQNDRQLLRPTDSSFSSHVGHQFNNTNKLFINNDQSAARAANLRAQDTQFTSNQQFPMAQQQQQQQQQQQRRPRPPKRHQIPSGGNGGPSQQQQLAPLTSRRQNVLLDFDPGMSTMSTPLASSRQSNRNSNLLMVDLSNSNNNNDDQQPPFNSRDNNLNGDLFQPPTPVVGPTPTRSNSFRPAALQPAINLRDSPSPSQVGTSTTNLPPSTSFAPPATRQRFNISPANSPSTTTSTTTTTTTTTTASSLSSQAPVASSTMSSLGDADPTTGGPAAQADPQAVANRYLSSAIDALEAGQPFGAVDYDFDILSDNSTDRRAPNGSLAGDYIDAPVVPLQPVAIPPLPQPKQTQVQSTTAVAAPGSPPANKRQSAAVTAAASIPLNDGQIVNMSDSVQGDGPTGVGRSRGGATANRGGPATTTSTAATTSSASGTPTRKPRPTNKKIVVNHEQALANIRASVEPAKRPEPLFSTPVAAQPAAKCDTRVCRLPDCKCGDTLTPAGLDPKVIPQVVLLTFDDAVNDLNWEIYEELFTGRTNPNGCPVLATFYVSHEWTDYGQVQTLYSRGHEMASHSVTHSFGEKFSKGQWFKEINGQREILNMYGGVKMNDVRGMRAPFLQIGGNKMFEMLYDANFTYDSSMPIFENSPPLWPYTLDYQLTHECMITPCPTKSYPGVWEVGMTMWVDLRGGRCSMGDACSNPTDEDGVYEMLMKNFNRHYKSNRAPFGLFYHSAWFNTVHHRRGFLRFMTTVNSLPDVFFVTNWQMLQWMRQPTPLSEINSFEPWQCPAKNDRPPPCYHPSVCNVKSEHGTRFMKTCQPCPANQQYPWVGATGFKQSKQNGSG